MNSDEIDYSSVAIHIPRAIQALYLPNVLHSITLEEFRDCFRIHQMQGKAWLFQNISNVDKNSKVLVVGSWLGFTSYCLFKNGFSYIHETDLDIRLSSISLGINSDNPNFMHMCDDVNHVKIDDYDLIINTSCEHIENQSWFHKIKPGSTVVLQSTNLKHDDHYNIANSLDEFIKQYPLEYSYCGCKYQF